MRNPNDNNLPPDPYQPESTPHSYQQGPGPQPAPQPQPTASAVQPRPPKRGLGCAPLALLLLLVAAIFGFSGWQFGRGSASSGTLLPGTTPAITQPPNSTDYESIREQVVVKVRPSVVQINVARPNGSGIGSGVIIDQRGYIVTNDHVVMGGQRLEVVLSDGLTLPAQITGEALADDLAVVKIDPAKAHLTVATIGDSSKLRVGQTVLAVGNPLGITQTVTSGIISALDRNVATGENGSGILPGTIQTDAPINPGNSGGALVDLQADLIGIPTLTAIDPQFKTPANGVGFAIPANRMKLISSQLINSGKVTNTGRAALGIQSAPVDPVLAAQNNLPVDHGVLIASITPGGPAAQAGLKDDDIIVQIDNIAIDNPTTLSSFLINKNPGDTIAVHVYRGQQQLTINVKLGELPPNA